jgi:hypothetical protein
VTRREIWFQGELLLALVDKGRVLRARRTDRSTLASSLANSKLIRVRADAHRRAQDNTCVKYLGFV